MDPYLEAPSLWPDVHHGLISEIQAVLNRRLRPRYHVRVEERVYISDENDPGRKAIVPDLKIVDAGFSERPPSSTHGESTADVELDLQVVLAIAYDRAAYDLEIDYRSEPRLLLGAEYTEWANSLLVSKGLRG